MIGSLVIPMMLSLAAVPQESGTTAEARGLEEVRFAVGETSVRALCTDGPRRVVMLGGVGEPASTWRAVLERLPTSVGACAYDRARETSEPRGWFELLDELRRIHIELRVVEPYVVVGHALGGMYARLYAADRRGDVAGLVLLEPVHEDLPELMSPAMPPADWARWMEERASVNADGVRESTLADRARRVRAPRLPVTVVTALGPRPVPESWDTRFVRQAARRAHASILDGMPSARHVPARRSGPDIPHDDPALAAEEIARMVRVTVSP